MPRITLALILTGLALMAGAGRAEDWPQWGGSGRDFRVPDPGLAAVWAEGAPATLWSRPLGEGYSGIAVVGQRLYTLYSEGEQEVVTALEAATGDEVWSHRYAAPRPEGMRLNYGPGPHTTPLVEDGRVFTVGTFGTLLALDADSGALLWQHDLWQEYDGFRLRRGYGASPLAWGGTVIVPVGGEGRAVMAFAQEDGRMVWSRHDFDSAQSSPILVEVEGATQMVLFIQDEVVALDPDDGGLLWRHPHKVMGPYNISTPVAGPGGQIFISSSYGGGSRLLALSGSGSGARVEELWRNKKMGIHFTNAIRIGEHIYASTGRGSPFSAALDASTGETVWRDRAIGRANYLLVGEKVLILEAEGRLMLAELTPDGPSILAESQLLDSQTWTVPSLVDSTLYLRDRQRILAVRLPLAD